MLKMKEILVRQLLGVATFVMCVFLILLGLVLAGYGISRREKYSSNNKDSGQTKKYIGRSGGKILD